MCALSPRLALFKLFRVNSSLVTVMQFILLEFYSILEYSFHIHRVTREVTFMIGTRKFLPQFHSKQLNVYVPIDIFLSLLRYIKIFKILKLHSLKCDAHPCDSRFPVFLRNERGVNNKINIFEY